MSIGIWQIAIVVILVVLLFGRGKISSLMGDVAKGIKSFKKGMASDVTDDNEPKNISDDNQDSKNPKKRINHMPTIGWFEILIVVAIAIIVLGPKDFPIMLKKVGSWIGTAKKYINNIQNEVSNIDIEDNKIEKKKKKKKMNHDEKESGFISHLAELRKRLIHSFIFL